MTPDELKAKLFAKQPELAKSQPNKARTDSDVITEILAIRNEFGNEGNVPLGHKYWDLLAEHRRNNQK